LALGIDSIAVPPSDRPGIAGGPGATASVPGVPEPAAFAGTCPFLERSTQPVVVCTLDGHILRANEVFAALTGIAADALPGRAYEDFVPVEERAAVALGFERLTRGEGCHVTTGRLMASDGTTTWIEWAVVPQRARGTCFAVGHPVSEEDARLNRHRSLRRQLADALERVVEGFALFDSEDRLVHCNERFRELYPGLDESAIGRVTFAELTRQLARSGQMPAARGREEAWIEERVAWHRRPSGIRHFRLADGRWMQVDEQPTSDGGIVLLRSDVTAVKEREQAYALFAAAVDQAGDSIELCDAEARILYVNPAFTRLTGFAAHEALGRRAPDLLGSEGYDAPDDTEMRARLAAGRVWSGRLTSRTRSGLVLHQDATISPLRDDTGTITHYVAVKRDVTAALAREAAIRHLAHHDTLTGLPNRALFRDRLGQALAETRRSGELRALMLLDLDRFKDINDTSGHDVGDLLLVEVARRLESCIREVDTVSRLGGDEFAVLQARPEGTAGAVALARRIIASIGRPFALDGREVHTSTSIGITMIPDDGDELDRLLKQADLALYRAKNTGRDTFQFFLNDFQDAVDLKANLERDLRHALDDGRLSLDFQPLVDLESMTIHGLEALLRWQHPTRGAIPPATFIPIAEESGLIVPMTAWVLETACGEARAWLDQGLPALRIAVNLSPVQFRHRGLVEMVEEALGASGLPAEHLELEIQERALVHDPDRALEILRRLADLGVNIAMDDFGTGYSSLSSLRRFPLHKVKIDPSFVQEVCTNPETAAFVKAIIGLGKSLRIRITAEGVETEDQLESLRGDGCEEVQGFLLSRPLPSRQIADFIRHALLRDPEVARRLIAPPFESSE
jgi:diguanylate cyclase (GGDEF)-like protein/PAS domain S-box-containing protein